MNYPDDDVRERARQVAASLMPRTDEIGNATATHIAGRMPALSKLGTIDLARAASRINSAALLHALVRGDDATEIVPSAETLRITRDVVQHGTDSATLARGYRMGISKWCEEWSVAVSRFEPDPDARVAVVHYGTTFVLTWLENVLDHIEAVYADESDRLVQEGALARAAYIKHALDGRGFDVGKATARLGYDFAGWHVAIVLSRMDDGQGRASLDTLARSLAGAITTARPLIARADADTTWCWIPTKKNAKVAFNQSSILVGQGQPAYGMQGFRQSHQQALEALRVSRIAASPAGTVTAFEDIEIAAVCSDDFEKCKVFVSAQLGPLADVTPEMAILRDTLWAFFNSGNSFRAAAAELGVHHNTVRYRVGRTEEILARPATQDRMKTELALYLASTLRLIGRLDGDGRSTR